jgi:hypothetical protein
MPRTCLACSSSERASIDKALVAGEPLRNIAKGVSISPAGLLRHKTHLSQAVVKASERREERLGDNLLEEMRRVQRKAWDLSQKQNPRATTEARLWRCTRCARVGDSDQLAPLQCGLRLGRLARWTGKHRNRTPRNNFSCNGGGWN